jgi:hypothetical protein
MSGSLWGGGGCVWRSFLGENFGAGNHRVLARCGWKAIATAIQRSFAKFRVQGLVLGASLFESDRRGSRFEAWRREYGFRHERSVSIWVRFVFVLITRRGPAETPFSLWCDEELAFRKRHVKCKIVKGGMDSGGVPGKGQADR